MFTEDLIEYKYKKTNDFYSLSESEQKSAYVKTTAAAIAEKLYKTPSGWEYRWEDKNGTTHKIAFVPNSYYIYFYKEDIEIDGNIFPGNSFTDANWDGTWQDATAEIPDIKGKLFLVREIISEKKLIRTICNK